MPLLAYGEILYDLTFTNSWHVKSIKYNLALAIVAIRTSFMEKPYQELGLESLQQPHWYGKPCFFFEKKWKTNLSSASSNLYQLLDKCISQDIIAVFLYSMLSMAIFKKFSFY